MMQIPRDASYSSKIFSMSKTFPLVYSPAMAKEVGETGILEMVIHEYNV